MPDQAAMTNVAAELPLSLVNSIALGRVANGRMEKLPTYMPRALDAAGSDHALMVHQSIGARVLDSAGRSYIDLCMGHGSLMLGHGAAPTKDALHRQLDLGWMHGFSHCVGERVAELIHEAAPGNERVMLCGSESDAAALAIRAARSYRGRDGIVVFSGATHGLHDFALVTAAPIQANDFGNRRNVHIGAGIPAHVDNDVTVLPYASDNDLDIISQRCDTLAAVIVEPIPSQRPSPKHGAWLKRLQALCYRCGVLLILDETFSGFRMGYGGAQVYFDLKPDLVVYGNALGGGLPIGAVAGKAQIMSVFGGGSFEQRIFCGTTPAGPPQRGRRRSCSDHTANSSRDHLSAASTDNGRALSKLQFCRRCTGRGSTPVCRRFNV